MVETITPAGCGGRSRQILALVLFGLAATVAAAAIGVAMGLLGQRLGMPAAAVAGGGLALAAVAGGRAARLRLPERRAQVPERWRRERPLPFWATGYGAILGTGLLTHQPLGGGWVLVGTSLAVADQVAGAAVGVASGLGRLAMVLPALGRDPRAAVFGIVARAAGARGGVVAGVGALGILVMVSPAAGAAPATAALDASGSGPARAYTQVVDGGTEVVVEVPGIPEIVIPNATQPSMDGPRVAVRDGDDVRVIDWTKGIDLARIPNAHSPALAWPHLAYLVRERRGVRLVVRDLESKAGRLLDRRKSPERIGRPVARRGVVVWHAATRGRSTLLAASARRGVRRVLRVSEVVGMRTPALGHSRVAWIEDGAQCSSVWVASERGGAPTLVAARPVAEGRFWNLDLTRGAVSVTIWDERTDRLWIDTFSIGAAPLAGCAIDARSPLRQDRAPLPALPAR